MDVALTAEQDEIRRALRELVAEHGGGRPPGDGLSGRRNGRAGGGGEAVERRGGGGDGLRVALAQRLALPGWGLPEAYGGEGGTVAEVALRHEELGRILLPAPALATGGLVAPLVARLGTGAQRSGLLPRFASGESAAALAVPGGLAAALGLIGASGEPWSGGGRAGGVQATWQGAHGESAGGWRLYGQAEQVLDGGTADVLLVAAHTGGFARSRTLLFLVRTDAAAADELTGSRPFAELTRFQQPALDPTRPLARIELRDCEAELLGPDDAGQVADALEATGRTVAVLVAAEAVGAAQRVLERAVAVRGVEPTARAGPAEVYATVRAARSCVYYAAWCTAGTGCDDPAAGLALAQAIEALRAASAEAVHLSAGLGAGREPDVQSYFARVAGDELLFGPAQRLRGHAADRAGVFAAGAGGSTTPAASPRVPRAAVPAPVRPQVRRPVARGEAG